MSNNVVIKIRTGSTRDNGKAVIYDGEPTTEALRARLASEREKGLWARAEVWINDMRTHQDAEQWVVRTVQPKYVVSPSAGAMRAAEILCVAGDNPPFSALTHEAKLGRQIAIAMLIDHETNAPELAAALAKAEKKLAECQEYFVEKRLPMTAGNLDLTLEAARVALDKWKAKQ